MEPPPSFWSHSDIVLGAFVWFGERDSPIRRPLLPLNAGTAEPVRVSPPEAVAYPLELLDQSPDKTAQVIDEFKALIGDVSPPFMALQDTIDRPS
jgi:hypothetical protein